MKRYFKSSNNTFFLDICDHQRTFSDTWFLTLGLALHFSLCACMLFQLPWYSISLLQSISVTLPLPFIFVCQIYTWQTRISILTSFNFSISLREQIVTCLLSIRWFFSAAAPFSWMTCGWHKWLFGLLREMLFDCPRLSDRRVFSPNVDSHKKEDE